MQHNLLTRDNSVALETRDAIPRPTSFNADARTIEAVIASATPVPRQDARGPFHEILDPAGLDIAGSRGTSVLDSHNRSGLDAVLGTLDDIRIEGDQVIGTIRFSSRPEIDPIVADVRSGVIQHLSVGYEVAQWREGTGGGGIRTRTAVKWTIRETSFVSVPADRTSRTRSDLPRTTNRQIRELAYRAGVSPETVDDWIDRGLGVDAVRGEVLDHMIRRGSMAIRTAHNNVTMDNPQLFIRAAGEALHHRVAPSFTPSGEARQFIGLRIPDIARECLTRRGENITGLGGPELVTRALHTSSDFPLILADTVGRTLRQSYTAAPSGVRALARQTTAQDFRTKHRLMLDSTGLSIEKVNEAGEFKSGTLAEGEETYKVDTFGRIIGISRQALVNDDVGAFTDLARRLGQAAASFEAQFLVDLLVSNSGLGPVMKDTVKLFDAAHGNVSGSGAAPADATLTAARLAMRKQTGLGGGLIDVTPWAVLVPSDIETATEKLLATIQPTATDDVNPWTALRLLVEPRLTDTKRWYVWADPARVDSLEYAYLAGSEGPQIETQLGFRVDGVELKVRLDYGAGFVDFRGVYSNAGQ